jgi:hypothetical protein
LYRDSNLNVHDRTRPAILPAAAILFDPSTKTLIPIADPDAAPDKRTARVLELRAIAAVTGECECGARISIPNRQARRDARRAGYALRATMAHAADCPAGDPSVPLAGIEGMRIAR